jgi:hypothetical protein
MAAACVLAPLLWLELLSFPGAPQTSLEASWNEVLVYAAGRGWQFGRDIVFTYGPWGFLSTVNHLGALNADLRLAWEIGGKLIIAAGLVAATRRQPLAHQIVFISACIWCGWIFQNSFYPIVICMAVVDVLLRGEERLWAHLACVVALAFLAQFKFTNLVMAASGVGVAAALHLWTGRRRAALAIAAGFCLSFLLWWEAAGQNLENIVPYLGTSLEVAGGYAGAMGVDESRPVFLAGLALVILWTLFIWDLARRKVDRSRSAAAAVFLGIYAIITWKYGFTRADGHTNYFFLVTLLLSIGLPASLMPERRLHWFWMAGIVGLIGFEINVPGILLDCGGRSIGTIQGNARSLARFRSFPDMWGREMDEAVGTDYLPATNRAVGSAAVDVVSWDQGVVLVNGLTYAPRPVFQSYIAYTPGLEALNLAFYRSGLAPAFVLWRQETVDSRFPTSDDAQLVPEMRRAYEVQLKEGGYVLLKRVREMPLQPLRRVLLAERKANLGDVIPVPESGGSPVWMQAGLVLTAMGRVRALAYRPPQIWMKVRDTAGKESTWRIVPAVAADGFLLAPFIEMTSDFAAFMSDGKLRGISSIEFEAPDSQGRFWKPQTAVRFWGLPELNPVPPG